MADQLGDLVVVDNDTNFRKMVKDALAWAGYNTLEFATAEDALPEIEQLRPVLVLADVHLPGISGYELCRQIRSAHGDELQGDTCFRPTNGAFRPRGGHLARRGRLHDKARGSR